MWWVVKKISSYLELVYGPFQEKTSGSFGANSFFQFLSIPYNCRKATRVEDVYKLEDILTSYELDVLEEAAKILLEEFNTPEVIDKAAQDKA